MKSKTHVTAAVFLLWGAGCDRPSTEAPDECPDGTNTVIDEDGTVYACEPENDPPHCVVGEEPVFDGAGWYCQAEPQCPPGTAAVFHGHDSGFFCDDLPQPECPPEMVVVYDDAGGGFICEDLPVPDCPPGMAAVDHGDGAGFYCEDLPVPDCPPGMAAVDHGDGAGFYCKDLPVPDCPVDMEVVPVKGGYDCVPIPPDCDGGCDHEPPCDDPPPPYECPESSRRSTNGEGLEFCIFDIPELPDSPDVGPYCDNLYDGYIGFGWVEMPETVDYACPDGSVRTATDWGGGLCLFPIHQLPHAPDLMAYCHWIHDGYIGFQWSE